MAKERKKRISSESGEPSIENPNDTVPALEQAIALEEKYAIDPDINKIEGITVTHPNRNPNKQARKKNTVISKKSDKVQAGAKTASNSAVPEEITGGLSKANIQSLSSFSSPACVTIYMPLHKTGQEGNDHIDETVFKAMLQQILAQLKSTADPDFVTKLMKPAFDLLKNKEFWNNQVGGIAFFIADGFFKYIRLATAPAQQFWINHSFVLKGLVPYIVSPEYFYLLVISKKQSKLFRATNFSMRYIGISELPNGIEDVVHLEEKDDQNLFRTGSSGAGRGANYHGTGAGTPDEKENISMYLAEVDKTLWQEVLNREHVPLVLAGVEYMVALFRNVSQYGNIWPEALTGSLEFENEKELYRQSRSLMDSYFNQRTEKALASYGDLSGRQLTRDEAAEIIPASYYSRIAHLFVQPNEKIWGTFDKAKESISIHEDQDSGDEDLLDKAIIQTILHGGEVHLVDKEHMPSEGKVAALFRY